MNKYLLHELASGSEDKKCIQRVEQRALRKQKDCPQQKVKSTVKQSQPSATTTLFAGQPQFNFRSTSCSFTPTGKAKPGTIYFVCSQQGNWRSQCWANSQILVSPQTLKVNKILPAKLLYKLSIYCWQAKASQQTNLDVGGQLRSLKALENSKCNFPKQMSRPTFTRTSNDERKG